MLRISEIIQKMYLYWRNLPIQKASPFSILQCRMTCGVPFITPVTQAVVEGPPALALAP